MTTISEAEEFLGRLKNGGPFPMFTSCCPAWVKYLELNNPHYLKNISSCKSPMEMLAAVIRDRYAEKDAADGRTTYQIAIMPCTAKKMPFGLGSGAAVIYGVTGGVAEAVVRYCLPDKSKNALRAVSVTNLRGTDGIREVVLPLEGQELRIAIVNGLANARELLRRIDAGEVSYHLIEVMSCQGGCVGGAGQPYGLTAAKRKRGAGLYESDSTALFKRAEKNPIVTNLLAEYGEERCHELLHVSYL